MALHANDLLDKLQLSDDPTHPAQIALRTYGLALFLSLGPSSIPFIVSFLTGRHSHKTSLSAFRRVLRRECGYDGFAFAITLGVGGGATLKRAWDNNAKHNPWISSLDRRLGLSPSQKSFIANFFSSSFSILLLQAGRRRSQSLRNIPRPGAIPIPYTYTPSNSSAVPSKSPSPTLDLTLLVLVRALDSALQSLILKFSDGPEFGKDSPSEVDAKHKRYNAKVTLLTTRLDAFVFWACSARIMWCFFYEPERLPSTYVKWIRTLADVDSRLLRTLRFLRNGEWTYSRGSLKHSTLLTTYAQDLGYPSIWGDPSSLPALGGSQANEAWKILGVTSRKNLGGVPCELVHGSAGSGLSLASSCTANAGIRGFRAFFEAMIIYLPAHFLPILITRPQVLLRPHRILKTLFSTVRSAAFLSSFISSFWLSYRMTSGTGLGAAFSQGA
ncbi:hypothetical protein D9757_002926 [Collybiopsis confluens]|uniref:Uncharacterized protein n=1 Tax=Collybiopsis confluens TaxID=2823264 RepID=A0A8H5HVA9_9AGAR|nr:hypothetical protein D9757_002926 [Collybiopsis confluens]